MNDGGDSVIDYKVEMDDDNDGFYSVVATGFASTSHTETGLSAGSSYKFRVSARNSVGYSTPSSVLTIVAATVPSQPSAPTTTLNGETSFTIDWNPPADLGGLAINGYRLEVKTSTSTFSIDSSNCDAENDSTVIAATQCTILVSTLRASPFDLADSADVIARVTATNSLGDSAISTESTAVSMPIADVVPDAPTALTRNDASTTTTQAAFSWTAPANDGGDTVIDYKVEMDDNNDGFYSVVATGVSSTSYTETGLSAG